MPACTVTREVRGSTACYSLSGKFEAVCAWDLSARLEREALPGVEIDFSQVTDFVDYGVAVVASAVKRLEGRSIRLRGLRQHQLRLFKYFGVEPVEQRTAREAFASAGLLGGAAAPVREVG